MRKGAFVAITGAIAAFFFVSTMVSVSAHTSLVSSDPAEGATLEFFPESITLVFSEPLLTLGEERSNYFEVFDQSDSAIPVASLKVAGAVMTGNMPAESAREGRFEVRYRAVASDGHVIRGVIDFSVGTIRTVDPTLAVGDGNEEDDSSGSRVVLGSLILLAVLAGFVIYGVSPRNSATRS